MTTPPHTDPHGPARTDTVTAESRVSAAACAAAEGFAPVVSPDVVDGPVEAVDLADGALVETPATIVLPERRGPLPHRNRLLGRTFAKVAAAGAPTTTRQAEVLNTAIIGTPTDERGVVIGEDRVSGALVMHDPFTGYQHGTITSPNVCVLGMIGSGKSSLLKTVYVERPLMLRRRRAVVIDKKIRDGEGEYAELTRMFGSEPYRFDPDDRGATCMNVLDPIITGGGKAQSRQLLTAMAEYAGDGTPLSEWHQKAVSAAYTAVMASFDDAHRVPVLPDLIARFPDVVNSPKFAGLRPVTLDLIEQAATSVQFRMERLLDDDLGGMFDRETSKHVKLQPKLTTFDISALPEDGPATSMVMLVANAWLTGLLTKERGWLTNFIAEEGWHLLSGPGGRVIRSKSKLSRGVGLAIVAAIHHISDIPPDSDAIAMIKEAQTIHLYRQEHDDDIADCVRYFNLEHSNAAALAQLPQGDHLLKVGTTREIRVRHVRTSREVAFTATDSAMAAGTDRAAS
jgi:hypothetical protein